MKRHRSTGRAHTCAACGEPSTLVETIGSATVCSPCVARLKAHARHTRAQRRGPSHAVRSAFRNDSRRQQRPTLA